MSDEIKSMNVHQRIHAVMSEIGTIAKKGYNAHHKYNYAKESDFVEAIRPLLIKYRLTIAPQVDLFTFTPENNKMVNVKVRYTITNIDNPNEFIDASIVGQGHDSSDKAVPKSLASARKYFLASTFMIATGDDPEADNVELEGSGKSSAKPTNSLEERKEAPKTSSFRRSAAVADTKKNDDF